MTSTTHHRRAVSGSAYPTHYPRNQWYVAGRGAELGRELFSRWILDDPICFFRRQDGEPVALIDRCIHRQMPLTKGRLLGDNVECGYHGLVFAPDGQAVSVPSQDRLPDSCRVHRYPIVESGGLLWIWMGEPDRADASLIPAHPWLVEPGWTIVGGTLHMHARAQLLNENLLDLSHVQFLHPGSIGADDVAEAPVTVDSDDRSVRVTRDMIDATSPQLFVDAMGLEGRIDRCQVAEFYAPGFHVTHLTAKPTGSADPATTYTHKVIHGVTPARGRSAHYFWLVARDYRIDDARVSELFSNGIPRIFAQDIAAVEAIEEMLVAAERRPLDAINLKIDGGPLRARRIIEQQLLDEQQNEGAEHANAT